MGNCCTVLDVSKDDPYIVDNGRGFDTGFPIDQIQETMPVNSARSAMSSVRYTQPVLTSNFDVYGFESNQRSASPVLTNRIYSPVAGTPSEIYPADIPVQWECTVPIHPPESRVGNGTVEMFIPYCTPRSRSYEIQGRSSPTMLGRSSPTMQGRSSPTMQGRSSPAMQQIPAYSTVPAESYRQSGCTSPAQVTERPKPIYPNATYPMQNRQASPRPFRCLRSPSSMALTSNCNFSTIAPPSPSNTPLCNTPAIPPFNDSTSVPRTQHQQPQVDESASKLSSTYKPPSYARSPSPLSTIPRCVRKPTISWDGSILSNEYSNQQLRLPERIRANA
jgi:hypothetical protein